jgi:CRP/FNR family transcriptional regulator
VTPLRDLDTHCRSCSIRGFCLPVAFTSEEVERFDPLVVHRIKVNKRASLYRAGDSFNTLYAIRSGSIKTIMLAEVGHEQVTGFHMLGEIVGFEGIGSNTHGTEAIALEDTEVCALPFAQLESLAQKLPTLQRNLSQMMSKEIKREQGVMLMLGCMRADERLAVFVLDLADRYHRRGYSSSEFILRLSRAEIGSYLGLKLETVSRLFSRFQADGLIEVDGRALKVLDLIGLKRTAGQLN